MPPPPAIPIKQKIIRGESTKLKIIISGAGLGGLGAAISLLLAGHEVTVLESSPIISEIGAGIQILPNASHILQTWALQPILSRLATKPRCVNMRSWKGPLISSMDFEESAARYPGRRYWDFHRADLHGALLGRVRDLGGRVRCGVRVIDVVCGSEGEGEGARVLVELCTGDRGRERGGIEEGVGGMEEMLADLVVGADGINSLLREVMIGRKDPAVPTGDLAYRLLLDTKEILKDAELAGLVTEPQVNYWLGEGMHVVNYVLKGGELFNMVLLVPDDMPAGASTLEGDVREMRAMFKDWDPRITKLLSLCKSVYKWKLCIRPPGGLVSWSHPSGSFTLLGDAVHATLPYLASGAGMALEDAAVLGECFSRIRDTSATEKRLALRVYELCRKERTGMVVDRGNLQQWLYHLPDGEEQEERDRRMRMVPTPPGEALAWRDPVLSPVLLGYDYIEDVEKNWPKEEMTPLSKL